MLITTIGSVQQAENCFGCVDGVSLMIMGDVCGSKGRKGWLYFCLLKRGWSIVVFSEIPDSQAIS